MTKEEKIINEAKRYYSGNIKCYDAFLHGVEFAEEHQKNIWHDVREEPKNGSHILIQYDYLGYIEYKSFSIEYTNCINWKYLVKIYDIFSWAYISDLLPKEGEK